MAHPWSSPEAVAAVSSASSHSFSCCSRCSSRSWCRCSCSITCWCEDSISARLRSQASCGPEAGDHEACLEPGSLPRYSIPAPFSTHLSSLRLHQPLFSFRPCSDSPFVGLSLAPAAPSLPGLALPSNLIVMKSALGMVMGLIIRYKPAVQPPEHTQEWREGTDSTKLSSEFRMHALACMCPPTPSMTTI